MPACGESIKRQQNQQLRILGKDRLIPMSEAHLRAILKQWRAHYNGSRPHMALGPGVPDPPVKAAAFPTQQSPHRIRQGFVVLAKSVLGGLHHEYSGAPAVA
jgi:hypothetical protein